MRWQRTARIGVAILGLGCAAAVYFAAGDRRKPTPPRPPEKLRDEQATTESANCTDRRYKDDVVTYVLNCAHVATYDDGRSRFEKITLQTKRDDEAYTILADVAEKKGQAVGGVDDPGEVTLTGHVRIDTSKGLTLLTDAATYVDSSGLITIPGQVTFTRDRLSGAGLGATYERGTSILSLKQDAHVAMSPDQTGSGAFTGTSDSLMLFRTQKYLRLDHHATIERDRETMKSDVAQLFFTEDEQNLQRIDLRGGSSVMPKGDRTTAPPEMHGDDITLGFHPNSRAISQSTLSNHATLVQTNASGDHRIVANWIDAHTALDGQTLTGLDAKTGVSVALPANTATNTPQRTITSDTLNAQGTEKDGLTAARFDGGTQFIETRPATRDQAASVTNGTSQTLVLALTGGFDGIDEAKFITKAEFTKGDMKATGDLATYNSKKQTLLIEPAAKSPSRLHAESGRVSVDARDQVLLYIDTEDVKAKGDVTTTMRPEDNAAKTVKSGLFESGKKTTGHAEEFQYIKGIATYVGTTKDVAKVYQDTNRVDADRVEVEDATGNLRATGRVRSSIMMDDTTTSGSKPPARGTSKPATTPAPQKPQVGTGKTLVYNDANRKATYTGDDAAPASLIGDAKVYAVRIDVFLAKEQRTADRIEADGDAHAWLEDNRELRGDHLSYVNATGSYVLKGTPAQVKHLPESPGAQCKVSIAPTISYQSSGAILFDGAGTSTADRKVDCASTLPRMPKIK